MRSIEAEHSDSSDEEPRSGDLGFLLETDPGDSEEEVLDKPPNAAELFLSNPAFKSEQAGRALDKLKEVWKSAEESIPEELKYELRHEHKDSTLDQNPVHIGEVVADAPSRQPGLSSMLPIQTDEEESIDDELIQDAEEDDEDGQPSGSVQFSSGTSIYRQAVIYGFGSAVAMLVLIALFVIIR